MATRLDDLIQRQDFILAEIDNLHEEELNCLANSTLPETPARGTRRASCCGGWSAAGTSGRLLRRLPLRCPTR